MFKTDTIERGTNAVSMSISPPATTESGITPHLLGFQIKQGQNMSMKTKVKVVIRAEGLKVKKITKLLHYIKFTYIFPMKNCVFILIINIYINFHQNRSINECSRMILVLKWSWMTIEVILHLMKNLCHHNVDILENFQRRLLNSKYIAEKDDYEILRPLRLYIIS